MKRCIVAMLAGILVQFYAVGVQAATEGAGEGVWYVPPTHKSKGLYDQLFQLSNEFERAARDTDLTRMCDSLRQIRKLQQDSKIALTEGQVGYMNRALLNISIRYLIYVLQSYKNINKAQLMTLQQNAFKGVLSILDEYGVQSVHLECAFAILNKLFLLYTENSNPVLINDAIVTEANGFVLLNMNTIYRGGTPQQEQVSRSFFGEYQWLSKGYISLIVQQPPANMTQISPYVEQPMNPYSEDFAQYSSNYYWQPMFPAYPVVDSLTLSQSAQTVASHIQEQPSDEVVKYFKSTGLYSVLDILAQSVFGLPSNKDGISTKSFSVDNLRNTYQRISSKHPQLCGYESDMQRILANLLQAKLDVSRERGMPKDDYMYQQKCKELFLQIIGK